MPPPLFSVIIPTYNRPSFLLQATESVLRQTVEDFEVLVVNDGGEAPLGLPIDSRLKLITRESNGGLSAARNTGLQAATGRYITFLDDDDLYLPTRLELALVGLRSAPIALCLVSSFTDGTDELSRPYVRKLEGYVHDIIMDDFAPHCGATALERTVTPMFDEDYLAGEDTEWWLRLSTMGPVTTVEEVGYLQRGHSGPRNLNTAEARLEFSRRLLEDYPEFFASRSRARSFRYRRNGMREIDLGLRSEARRSLLKSLRARPSVRSLWHLLRTFGPS